MKIKFKHLDKALYYLRSKAGLRDDQSHEIEVSVREEDVQSGKLGSCLVFTFKANYKASEYEDVKTEIHRDFTLEIFSDDENRPPRMTTIETRDLDFK